MHYLRDFGDELETSEDYESLLKKRTNKEILNKDLKTRFRMAKLNIDLERFSDLIFEAVGILPDYEKGEKLIEDFLKNEENFEDFNADSKESLENLGLKLIDKNQTIN